MMHLKHTYTDLLPNPDAGFGALTEVYNTLLQNGPHADSYGTKNLPRSNFFAQMLYQRIYRLERYYKRMPR